MNPYLFDTIAAICERVSEDIEFVNSGGCAVFASELGKRLQAIGVKNVNCRVYNYPEEMEWLVYHDLNTLEAKIREHNGTCKDKEAWNDSGIHFVHVKLYVDGVFWDSDGAVLACEPESKVWEGAFGGYELVEGFISVDTMSELASEAKNWNPTFQRDCIPDMTKIMDVYINEYMNSTVKMAA